MRNSLLTFAPSELTINEEYQVRTVRCICDKCGKDESGLWANMREQGWCEIENITLCPNDSPYKNENVCPACQHFSPYGKFHNGCKAEVNDDLQEFDF